MQVADACRTTISALFSKTADRLILEKVADPNLQAACERLYRVEGRVSFPPLNAAHVGPNKTATLREVLLRHPGFLSQSGNTLAELLSERDWHAPKCEPMSS